jgi:hypothetical protein
MPVVQQSKKIARGAFEVVASPVRGFGREAANMANRRPTNLGA